MTIALFGGTGRSGHAFIPRALAAGHTLRLLARTPGKLSVQDDSITVIEGDVLDAAAVDRTVAGSDIVISLIGQTKGGSKTVQTDGTRNMIAAMEKHGLRRIISMSGGGLPFHKDEPKFIDKAFRGVMGLFLGSVIDDAVNHGELLKASNLDWTVVRGPRLVEEADRGSYKVGYVGTTGGSKISRGDVADFILKIAEEGSYVHDMPFLSW